MLKAGSGVSSTVKLGVYISDANGGRVLVTMAVESAVGVADERRKASVPSPASETGGDAAA